MGTNTDILNIRATNSPRAKKTSVKKRIKQITRKSSGAQKVAQERQEELRKMREAIAKRDQALDDLEKENKAKMLEKARAEQQQNMQNIISLRNKALEDLEKENLQKLKD